MSTCKSLVGASLLAGSLSLAAPAQAAFLAASIGVTDLGAPNAFNFVVATPIAVLTGPVSWSANFSGALTDGSTDGVSAAPVGGSIFEFLIDGTTVGTDALGTVTTGFSDSVSGIFDCGVAGCSNLSGEIHFTGTGGSDAYSMSFTFTVGPAGVPAPGVLALMAAGLVGLVPLRRRRRH